MGIFGLIPLCSLPYLPLRLKDLAGVPFIFESFMNLTIKQEKFCQKYIETGNASEAYRQSYDCENSNDQTIWNEASDLLKNPEVALRLAELEELQLKRHAVTVDRVVAEYAKIAFLDIRKIFDEDGDLIPVNKMDADTAAAIAGVESEEIFEGYGQERRNVGKLKKIKLVDKKGALDSLGKHLGMFIDRAEITGKNGGAIELSDAKSTLLRGLVPDSATPGANPAN